MPPSRAEPSRSKAATSAASIDLDQDAVRKHMLQLMQQAQENSGDSEDESGSSSDDDEQTDGESTGKVQLEMNDEDSEAEADQPVSARPISPSPTNLPSRVKLAPKASNDVRPKINLKDSFKDLGISQQIISTLGTIAIKKPTEIQAACIEPMLAGRDCIGGAKTGSGKTMAFALPILQRISRDPFGIFAVVLTPTRYVYGTARFESLIADDWVTFRELAFQLAEQFIVLGKPLGLTTSTIVGGMDMMKQATELKRKPHVVVATPGRLVDLLKSSSHGQWDLSRVKTLVLDEADRMLTPTFAPDLKYLFSQLPEDRQTCLFTATISDEIEALAARPPRNGKQKPFVHRVESDTLTVANLKQQYMFLPGHIRDPYLYYLLTHPPSSIAHLRHKNAVPEDDELSRMHTGKGSRKRKANDQEPNQDDASANIPSTIIFTQRCATANLLHLMLTELDIPSVPLHSHLTQPQRLLSLAKFRAGQVPVLVTTDVGSRGLDIPEVALVVNWDCPRTGEDYVHRVGRTARAGRGGLAVTIITERDVELVKGIEDLTST